LADGGGAGGQIAEGIGGGAVGAVGDREGAGGCEGYQGLFDCDDSAGVGFIGFGEGGVVADEVGFVRAVGVGGDQVQGDVFAGGLVVGGGGGDAAAVLGGAVEAFVG
jgi:hypothetical protein